VNASRLGNLSVLMLAAVYEGTKQVSDAAPVMDDVL